MKKANFSLVLSSIVFLLFLGVSAAAQADGWTSTNLDGKVLDISDISVPDVGQAIDILGDALKALPGMPQGTLAQEANVSARMAYYTYLLDEMGATNSVIDVLPYSGGVLAGIVARFKTSLNVNAVTIYDEVKTLLDQ